MSYENVGVNMTLSNPLQKTVLHSFAILGENGLYKIYLIPLNNTTLIDLVTGKTLQVQGTGTTVLYSEYTQTKNGDV